MMVRPITAFVKSLDKDKEYELDELHELHVQWCKEHGFYPLNKKELLSCFQNFFSMYWGEMRVREKNGKYYLKNNFMRFKED